MNVLFVNPGNAAVHFPHQYAVLSSYIKMFGHKTKVYNAFPRRETADEAVKRCDFGKTDVVCMTVLTGWQDWVGRFTFLVKQYHPKIKVIVGGFHISALKELAVKHIGADYGVVGEGEMALIKILNNIQDSPRISYCTNRIRDFDHIPLPDYQTFRPDTCFSYYLGAAVSRRSSRIVQTFTSRGCPYHCTFCATNAVWNGKMVYFSPKRVIKEIKYLIKNFGIEEIWFGDDGFTTDRERAKEICRRIIGEGLEFHWRLPNGIRLDSVDEELAALMSASGCYMTGVGIETGSPSMMRKIKKNLDLGIVRDKVNILKSFGIIASGFFMMGFPDETKAELAETVDFILNSNLDRVQICAFELLPGSEEFDKVFDSERKIEMFLYDGYIPDYQKYLSKEQILDERKKTLWRFYKSRFLNVMKGMSHRQIRDIIKRYLVGL